MIHTEGAPQELVKVIGQQVPFVIKTVETSNAATQMSQVQLQSPQPVPKIMFALNSTPIILMIMSLNSLNARLGRLSVSALSSE
jgi:hypothetical protein